MNKTVFYALKAWVLKLISKCVQSSEKGSPNGIATLDTNGKITSEQLPSIITYKEV